MDRRTKGVAYERWVARALRPIWPEARRGLQYQEGSAVPDVVVPVFHIECKRNRRADIKAAMCQAVRDCADHRMPVVVSKDDNADSLVTMRLEDWVEVITDWWKCQNQD